MKKAATTYQSTAAQATTQFTATRESPLFTFTKKATATTSSLISARLKKIKLQIVNGKISKTRTSGKDLIYTIGSNTLTLKNAKSQKISVEYVDDTRVYRADSRRTTLTSLLMTTISLLPTALLLWTLSRNFQCKLIRLAKFKRLTTQRLYKKRKIA